MANRANLIATYNANPTLQSRYTLQQYLDLFGFGATTTPTPDPDPTPTPTPEQPGIPNIINQNLNQGGGGDGGPQGIATPSTTLQKTYDPTQELSIGEYFSGVEGSPIYTSTYTERQDPLEGIVELFQKYSPIGMIGRKIEQNKIQKEKTQQALMQRNQEARQREREALARIEAEKAAAAARLANPVTYRYNDPSQRAIDDPSGGNRADEFTGGGTTIGAATYTDTGREGFAYGLADGGRVYLYNRLK